MIIYPPTLTYMVMDSTFTSFMFISRPTLLASSMFSAIHKLVSSSYNLKYKFFKSQSDKNTINWAEIYTRCEHIQIQPAQDKPAPELYDMPQKYNHNSRKYIHDVNMLAYYLAYGIICPVKNTFFQNFKFLSPKN